MTVTAQLDVSSLRSAVRGLPPGEYRIVAIPDPDNGAWFNAAYLTTLVPLSTPITLGEGDRKTMDIKVR